MSRASEDRPSLAPLSASCQRQLAPRTQLYNSNNSITNTAHSRARCGRSDHRSSDTLERSRRWMLSKTPHRYLSKSQCRQYCPPGPAVYDSWLDVDDYGNGANHTTIRTFSCQCCGGRIPSTVRGGDNVDSGDPTGSVLTLVSSPIAANNESRRVCCLVRGCQGFVYSCVC